LFGKPTSAATASRGTIWLWSSLVPATACAILTLMAGLPGALPAHQASLIPSALSNFTSAAYVSGASTIPQNHLAAVTFDWTNQGNTYSSIRFASSTNFSH